MHTASSKNCHLLLPQVKRSSAPKKYPTSFWSCPFFFMPPLLYRLLISIFQFQSSKDVFWAQRTHVILPLAAVQTYVCISQRSCWWLPNPSQPFLPLSAPQRVKTKPQQTASTRKKNPHTSFSDLPSIGHIPPASQKKKEKHTPAPRHRINMWQLEGERCISFPLYFPHSCWVCRGLLTRQRQGWGFRVSGTC